ncbi:MAG: hypothetical protein K8R58_13130 [Bacteroidales bacterium]|nr:hypothetical protein [Bacteroidales bacterium]
MKSKKSFKLATIFILSVFIFSISYAQDIPTDTVCAGSSEYYKVLTTPGSTYTWVISNGGTPTYGVDIKSDSIRIQWSVCTQMETEYIKVVETNEFGRSGDTITLQVLRYPIPSAIISGSDTLFDGNTGTEKIKVTLTGTPPWDIIYNDGKTNITVNGIEATPYTIKTRSLSNPPLSHTYTLVSVKNESGCEGEISGSAIITVSPPIKTSKIFHR